MATSWILDSTGIGDELNRAVAELLELDQRRHEEADRDGGNRRRRRRRPQDGGAAGAAAAAAAGWLDPSRFFLDRHGGASSSSVLSSDETLDSWCNPDRWSDCQRQQQRGSSSSSHSSPPIPEEYRALLNSVVIHPQLWSDSSLRRSLRSLRDRRSVWPPTRDSFPTVARRLVRTAWPDHLGGGRQNDDDVERFEANVPGVASGNMYEGTVRLYDSLGWEGPYLHAALEELIELEGGTDPQGLRIVCAVMLRGSRQCRARKSFVFCAVVGRVEAIGGRFDSSDEHDDGEGERACRHLHDVLASYLDELKSRAFRSTFLEPTKMYFRATNDGTMEGDVDVHGANVYLAVLASTLGVALDRTPHLGDNVKAVVDFVDAGMTEPLRGSCWDPNRVGVSWESIPTTPSYHGIDDVHRLLRPVPRNHFIFSGRTALDVATAAIDCAGPFNSSAREGLRPYLEQFCSYFAAPFVLRRMFSYLTGGGTGESAERAAEVAYRSMRDAMRGPAPSMAGGDGDSWPEDLRHFCWDVESDPVVFREDNARLFFAYLGVCRYNDAVEETYLDVDDGAEDCSPMPEGTSAGGKTDAYLDVD